MLCLFYTKTHVDVVKVKKKNTSMFGQQERRQAGGVGYSG